MRQIVIMALLLMAAKAYSDSQDRYTVIEIDHKQYCTMCK